MSTRPYEVPCAHCRVTHRPEFLVDISDLIALAGKVCADCEHELVSEHHDDDTCDCSCCERARARADRIRDEAAKDAPANHGISALGMELLGWTEEDL
jgi:hypothetical protein